jgi:hypothetical protein
MKHIAQQDPHPTAGNEATCEVHDALVEYLSRRPDLGLDKMLLNLAREPAGPFDPKGRKNFRKGFVLLLLVATGLTATFVYFNFLAGWQ